MNLKPDPLAANHIDLTASMPSLKSSLSPASSEFSNVTSRLVLRDAEEFSKSALGLMFVWALGFVALLSIAVIFWS